LDKLRCRGIRGAITLTGNDRENIMTATKRLLKEILRANEVEIDDIAAIIFTTTPDLNAEFPAAATRELGWPQHIALLCGHEMDVPGGLPHCLRILMLVNTKKKAEEITHIYLEGAKKLKDDKLAVSGDKA
jgi:chorismate mutase